MKVKVLKLDNTQSSVELKLDSLEISNLDTNLSIVHRVYRQAEKQGTKKVKGRSEVRGKAKKPFKQKGTGSARQGSLKGPHRRGGGVAHGPRPDTTTLKLNKKFKSGVLRDMLSTYLSSELIKFVELTDDKKSIRSFFTKQPKTLYVYTPEKKDVVKSLRNLENMSFMLSSNLNSFDISKHANVLVDVDAREYVENLLKK